MAMSVRYTMVNGMVVYENRGGAERDYMPNTSGSAAALLDSGHNMTDTWTYWPYGDVVQRTGTTATPFGYGAAFGIYACLSSTMGYARFRTLLLSLSAWPSRAARRPGEPPYSVNFASPTAYVDPDGLYPLALAFPNLVDWGEGVWEDVKGVWSKFGKVTSAVAAVGGCIYSFATKGFTYDGCEGCCEAILAAGWPILLAQFGAEIGALVGGGATIETGPGVIVGGSGGAGIGAIVGIVVGLLTAPWVAAGCCAKLCDKQWWKDTWQDLSSDGRISLGPYDRGLRVRGM
jgi:hypothetical protein